LGLIEHKLPEGILVDCSHANSWKKFQGQEIAWRSVVDQRVAGNDALVGLMLESNLFEGHQKFGNNPDGLTYGVSITDECISWDTTERLVSWAAEKIAGAV
jgi:3-deoxy-7-phosphoheptulonate synthase